MPIVGMGLQILRAQFDLRKQVIARWQTFHTGIDIVVELSALREVTVVDIDDLSDRRFASQLGYIGFVVVQEKFLCDGN